MNKLNEIQQKLSAPKIQHNTFGNYNYRSCEDIVEAVKPLLGDATLICSDEMVMLGDRFYIKATVTLTQEKEIWIATGFARESEIKKGMDSAQITGAASSYARKYALNGLFAIDDIKDADTQKPTNQIQPKPALAEKKKPDNSNLHHWQKVIGLALMAINDNDQIRAGDMLVELTKSDDGKYKGFNSVKSLKSEKQAKFIFDNKIKEKYAVIYDVNSLLTKYEVVTITDKELPELAKGE